MSAVAGIGAVVALYAWLHAPEPVRWPQHIPMKTPPPPVSQVPPTDKELSDGPIRTGRPTPATRIELL